MEKRAKEGRISLNTVKIPVIIIMSLIVMALVFELLSLLYVSYSFDNQYRKYQKNELVRIVDLGQKENKAFYARAIPQLDVFLGSGVYNDRAFKQDIKLVFTAGIGSLCVIIVITIAALLVFVHVCRRVRNLNTSETRFRAIFNSINNFIGLYDENFKTLEVNSAALRFSGISKKDMQKQPLPRIPMFPNMPGSRDVIERAIREVKNGKINRYEILFRNAEGKYRIFDFAIYPVVSDDRSQMLYVAEGKDIHDLKEKEREVYHFAFYDKVTGLPNEKLFEQLVNEALSSGEKKGAVIAVIKVDGLSFINKMFGLRAGDAFLRSFSLRLLPFTENGCIVSRLMGGNFLVYIPELKLKDENSLQIYETLNKFCSTTEDPVHFGAHEMHVKVRIGAAVYPDHGETYAELLKNAIAAKDEAKGSSGNCIEIFDSSATEKIRRKRKIENDLRSAGLEEMLSVKFQPQVDLKTGKISGYETLVRWTHPELGNIPPVEFIPVAESTGTIERIFSFVVDQAASLLSAADEKGLSVSVNVSADQLIDENFPSRLSSVMTLHNIEPKQLAIEITESLMIESFDTVLPMLHHLRERGFKIHLDDFGTGFSSLSYLRKLPIDVLKIDKSFISDIDADVKSKNIFGALVSIAHDLGISVIAEGAETEENLSVLKGFGCDISQGWFTGRPISRDDVLISVVNKKIRR